MAIDINRILQAAAEAVLEGQDSGRGQQPSEKASGKGLTAPRALLIGAGAYTVGRLLVRARAGGLTETLQQRLAEYESRLLRGEDEGDIEEDLGDDEGFYDEEHFEDEEPQDEYDETEELDGEYDEDEEPEDEYQEEGEPEGAGSRRNGRH
jgi:hypothetical protein